MHYYSINMKNIIESLAFIKISLFKLHDRTITDIFYDVIFKSSLQYLYSIYSSRKMFPVHAPPWVEFILYAWAYSFKEHFQGIFDYYFYNRNTNMAADFHISAWIYNFVIFVSYFFYYILFTRRFECFITFREGCTQVFL